MEHAKQNQKRKPVVRSQKNQMGETFQQVKKPATKAVRKQAKKQAKCPRCNGQGFVETPSAINSGRTFRVICTQCN